MGDNFGEWLWRERSSRGLTQVELAKLAGLSGGPATISGLERGRWEPRPRLRLLLELLLGKVPPLPPGSVPESEWIRPCERPPALTDRELEEAVFARVAEAGGAGVLLADLSVGIKVRRGRPARAVQALEKAGRVVVEVGAAKEEGRWGRPVSRVKVAGV